MKCNKSPDNRTGRDDENTYAKRSRKQKPEQKNPFPRHPATSVPHHKHPHRRARGFILRSVVSRSSADPFHKFPLSAN
ncbi:hypothetical protein GWI33_006424 [Rhynchophorus ferrugineus]|uniref:Uncharacterized protein n=1 Tax=Rhynchophorus ferrugineus TaxID=354439 RepID=A0A834IL69_RHYFE|nr:hypothetical protein GWI33_006424 [Rhynchophorus ferrugineus]